MVLWEITLGTAYFLGLKRTYRLALKIQRRIISPKRPKIRQFAQRRTRAAFDLALSFHRKIQERDIEAGRNFGNWILRWLDKMKPSAEIRIKHLSDANGTTKTIKHLRDSSNQKKPPNLQNSDVKSGDRDSGRHLFTSSKDTMPKSSPTIGTMMNPTKPTGSNIHSRQFSICSRHEAFQRNHGRSSFEGVIRKDIMEWMLHN